MLFKSHQLIWKALPALTCVCIQFVTESWKVEGWKRERGRASLWPRSTGRGDYVALLSCVLTFRMLLNFNRLSSGFTDYSYWGWIHYPGFTSHRVFAKISITPTCFSHRSMHTCTYAHICIHAYTYILPQDAHKQSLTHPDKCIMLNVPLLQ